jgi:predicted ABC-type exoprotein transport system permease subunit
MPLEEIKKSLNEIIVKIVPIILLCFGVSSIVFLDAYHNKKHSMKQSLLIGLISLILSCSLGISIVLMKPDAVFLAIITTSVSALLSRSIVSFLTDEKNAMSIIKKLINKYIK